MAKTIGVPKEIPKEMWPMIGGYAFILGVLLSIALGVFVSAQAWLMAILAILGLLVALLNIADKEVTGYLIANIAVIVSANAFNGMLAVLATPLSLGGAATILQTITGNLVFFVTPGAVLLSLKEIYNIAKAQ